MTLYSQYSKHLALALYILLVGTRGEDLTATYVGVFAGQTPSYTDQWIKYSSAKQSGSGAKFNTAWAHFRRLIWEECELESDGVYLTDMNLELESEDTGGSTNFLVENSDDNMKITYRNCKNAHDEPPLIKKNSGWESKNAKSSFLNIHEQQASTGLLPAERPTAPTMTGATEERQASFPNVTVETQSSPRGGGHASADRPSGPIQMVAAALEADADVWYVPDAQHRNMTVHNTTPAQDPGAQLTDAPLTQKGSGVSEFPEVKQRTERNVAKERPGARSRHKSDSMVLDPKGTLAVDLQAAESAPSAPIQFPALPAGAQRAFVACDAVDSKDVLHEATRLEVGESRDALQHVVLGPKGVPEKGTN